MNQSDKKSLVNPLRQATLVFLIRNDEMLLAMKKRGFGEGKWNGVGGKAMIDETIIDAAIRETEEEIKVTPKNLQKVATMNFYFPKLPKYEGWDQQVVAFFVHEWDGEPTETEEMAPKWFSTQALPYSQMWPDDIHWMPKVLQGNRIEADFHFDKELRLDSFTIKEI